MANTNHHYVFLGLINRVIALVASAAIGAAIGWWALVDREPCYQIVGGEARPNPAAPNAELDLQLVIEVVTPGCGGVFIREIVSSTGWVWTSARTPISFSVLPRGRWRTHSQVPFKLPRGMDVGDAVVRLHVWFTRPNNPLTYLWPIYYTSPDLHFTIKAADEPPVR